MEKKRKGDLEREIKQQRNHTEEGIRKRMRSLGRIRECDYEGQLAGERERVNEGLGEEEQGCERE